MFCLILPRLLVWHTIISICKGQESEKLKIPDSNSVQFSLSVMSDSVTPWTAAQQASLSITNSRSLLKLMSIDAIQPSHPLSSPSPIFNLSQHQGLFRWVNSSHRWPKYWNFSFSISLSNEYSGLIPFRMDWLDLLAVQGTLKSLLQHHSSKASVLWHSSNGTPLQYSCLENPMGRGAW